MARAPNEKIEKARKLYLQGRKLVEIAEELDVPEGTVRSWKNRYEWNATLQNEKRNVAKIKKKKEDAVSKDVDQVVGNGELTDKQRLFCLYYVRCFNATKAYQKAYEVKYETAAAAGSRMLENVKIKEEIKKLKKNRLNREMLDESDIFQKYMDIAFSDITDYVSFGTEEVPVMAMYGPVQIKDEKTGKKKILTQVVNTVRFKDSKYIDGTLISEVKQGKDGASIKLLDKMKALDWLANHMDIATEEQRMRIAALRAKIPDDDAGTQDDGFLDALKGLVSEVWEE